MRPLLGWMARLSPRTALPLVLGHWQSIFLSCSLQGALSCPLSGRLLLKWNGLGHLRNLCMAETLRYRPRSPVNPLRTLSIYRVKLAVVLKQSRNREIGRFRLSAS